MKMYKTGGWKSLIEEVEVVRANEKSVWIMSNWRGQNKEERSARETNYSRYFDTKEEAKAFLTERCNKTIESAKRTIARAEDELKSISEY